MGVPLAVALVTVVVFGRLVWCGFTEWDDPSTIRDNRRLAPPSWTAVRFYWTTVGEQTPGQLYTPVTYTVWSAVAAACGIRPMAFHGANVLLHATAAVMAYGLLRRLFGNPWAAAAGALAFALHPVQVESVGWASGTKDVLCGLFSIAALWAYVAAVQAGAESRSSTPAAGRPGPTVPMGTLAYAAEPGGGRSTRRILYLVATSWFLLAMLAKPTAIVVPLMAAVIDRMLLGRPWRTVAAWLWPWAVLMVPCGLWTRAAQPAPWASPVPAWTRPLVATDAVAFYLGKLVWPAHLGVDYGRRPTVAFASGALWWTWVVPAGVVAVVAWRRSRGAAAAGLLFLLPLAPVSGLVPFDMQFYSTVADHYLYLPMLGVAVGVAMVLSREARWHGFPTPVVTGGEPAPQIGGRSDVSGMDGMPVRRWVAATSVATVLAALAVRSVVQEPVWQDTAKLFQHALAVNPRSFVACDMLGGVEAFIEGGRIRGDRLSVPATDPRYAEWRGHVQAGLGWYQRSLDRYDGYVPSLINTATYAGQLGDRPRQRAALRRVVALQPTLPAAMRAEPVELVRRLVAADDTATAAAYLDDQIRRHPDDVSLLLLQARVGSMSPGTSAP